MTTHCLIDEKPRPSKLGLFSTWNDEMNPIFRPIAEKDFSQFYDLTEQIGVGMGSSFKLEKRQLEKKLCFSVESFSKTVTTPNNEIYIFVLVDKEKSHLLGTCTLGASIGQSASGCYTLKLEETTISNKKIGLSKKIKTIQLIKAFERCSYNTTCFVQKAFRKKGLGRILAQNRLKFFLDNPSRFHATISVEIRGLCKNGRYPFWEGFGRHYFKSLTEPEHLKIINNGLEEELLSHFPKEKIPVSLLSVEARNAINQVHESAKGNLQTHLKLGYDFTGYIGYMSGGPFLKLAPNQTGI